MKSTQPSNQLPTGNIDSLMSSVNKIDNAIDKALVVDVLPDQLDQIISANDENSKLFIYNVELE